ncbi:MAG TPA: cache domain-containing protein [Nitrososphaeraceae archaeon]|nr:cache domain-containing protein [Nitrososphaeraceae archaeon]
MSLIITFCCLTIFIILSLGIGIVNVQNMFFEPANAQADINTNYNTTASNSTQNNISLITNVLAMNLENRIQKAGAILEITSKLPQVRDVPYAHLLNQTLSTLHGIPQYADIEKRQVVESILSSNNDLYEIFLLLPNGDMYFLEPYSIQQTLTLNNFAFRDYFQGAIKTNDTYLGNVHNTAAASGASTAKIAVPVYSLKDNSTIVGVWASSIDFSVLNKELQLLNLTSLEDSTRVVYVDSKGQKIADSDTNKSTIPESFSNLKSFKSAIGGQAGSTIDTVDKSKMLVAYQPANAFHNTWVVLFMQLSPPP